LPHLKVAATRTPNSALPAIPIHLSHHPANRAQRSMRDLEVVCEASLRKKRVDLKHRTIYGNQMLPLASTNSARAFIWGTHWRCQFKFHSSVSRTRRSDRSVKLLLIAPL